MLSLSSRQKSRRHKPNSGFSLVELLVVVAILAILAAIAIPLFLNQKGKAQTAALQSDMHNLIVDVEAAKETNGTYLNIATVKNAISTSGWKSTKPNFVEVWPNCSINAGGTASVVTPGSYVLRGYPKTVGVWSVINNTELILYESSSSKWTRIPYNGTDPRWNVLNSSAPAVNPCNVSNGGLGTAGGWWQDDGTFVYF